MNAKKLSGHFSFRESPVTWIFVRIFLIHNVMSLFLSSENYTNLNIRQNKYKV